MKQLGIEVEIAGVSRQVLRQILSYTSLDSIKVHDDGSLRDQTYIINGIGIQPMYTKRGTIVPSGCLPADVVGAELVTSALSFDNAHYQAKELANLFGHLATSSRSSIHIHMDATDKTWRWMQNLARWFYYLEAPLYRLARMGELYHRGVLPYTDRSGITTNNEHRYARPLSNSIGMMTYNSRWVPAIDIDELLNANTCSEMFAAYGRLDRAWGNIGHYCPQRLHGLNFMSLMRHGTVELRIFNGDVKYLPAAVEIAIGLYQLADQHVPENMKAMPLGTQPNGFMLKDISRLLDVDPAILRPLWRVEGQREWVAGCTTIAFPHHYNVDGANLFYAVSSRNPVVKIISLSQKLDDDKDTFQPAEMYKDVEMEVERRTPQESSLRSRFSTIRVGDFTPNDTPSYVSEVPDLMLDQVLQELQSESDYDYDNYDDDDDDDQDGD